jgi:hypothetical protein
MSSAAASGASAGSAPASRRGLATFPGRLCRRLAPARPDLSQWRVDDRQGPSRVIRSRPTVPPATVLAIAVSSLIDIEAPHTEEETDPDGASDQGQQEDRHRLLQRDDSQESRDGAHAPENTE